ncbi:MAG: hypothetical protein V4520_17850 [Bacteroidota bacterium]
MNKGRCIFLFGAGATLQWGSPLTSELTAMILESGFKITKSVSKMLFAKEHLDTQRQSSVVRLKSSKKDGTSVSSFLF